MHRTRIAKFGPDYPARRIASRSIILEISMPNAHQTDLDLVRETLIVSGPRVRVRADLLVEQATRLLARGLAELAEDVDEFDPKNAQHSLKVTQYGYDLILGRIAS